MQRSASSRFFDGAKAGEIDLPGSRVLFQQRQHEGDCASRVFAHDRVYPIALGGVVLVNAFQAILDRTITDVLVVRRVNLFLRNEECLVFSGNERRSGWKVKDVTHFQATIFFGARFRIEAVLTQGDSCHDRSLRDP